MRKSTLLLSLVLSFVVFQNVKAADTFVSFKPVDGAVELRSGKINVSDNDFDAVKIAAASLRTDMQKVLGFEAAVTVGTLGRCPAVDDLERKGLLPGLKGHREMFILTTVEGKVFIAGSDRRGTVYGIYELSRQLGVSPWYWWADVPVVRHDKAYIKNGAYTDGEPAVEFRGLFLNDEAPCLTSWVKNTWGTNYGDHRFYERVFELILRLRGNMLWPAMWGWAFYADDPENSPTADRMGVIMGTSHHEPMARNHQEYARHRKEWGAWNYATNKKQLDRFFREGIERMKGTEDMVTIGMRGDGDEAMSEDADTKLLQQVVEAQRKIIKDVTRKPANKTTQVWALYKEVLDYYDKGMRVPDDVIMLLCDDNWGNVRRVPTGKPHKGGWGLYYHVDYVGAPRNTKWLNVTPSQSMWEQLTLAYDYGIRRMWILNVGDLKPMEYPIQLFLDMAWNPASVGADVEQTHTRKFCEAAFGEKQGAEAARLLNLVSKMNGRCTPEMLDARTYNLNTGEWRSVADDYMRLEAEALRQFITLPKEYHDAYRQLILFPVQAMANLYQMYYAQAMNHSLYQAGDPAANEWADKVGEAFRRDSLLCAEYNNDIAGGKWRGMMTQKHIGYRSWNDNFPRDIMPQVQRIDNAKPGGFTFTLAEAPLPIQADQYYEAQATEGTKWTVIPHLGRNRCGLSLMPYTASAQGARLTYRWIGANASERLNNELKVTIVTRSTLDFLNKGGLCYRVSIDGNEPVVVNFNENLNEKPENVYSIYYPTVAKRVVERTLTLKADPAAKAHTLTIEPLDPAIVFEKIVVDPTGKAPATYLHYDNLLPEYRKE